MKLRKFSSESGLICIKGEKNKDYIVIKIKDQGVGISQVDQQRIFEKFFQADKSHSIEGSGLGLAIVKKIVEIYKNKTYMKGLVSI